VVAASDGGNGGVVDGVCVVEEENCLLLSKLFVVVGANWQVAPLFFFQAQTSPHGLCAAPGYINTHEMSAFFPQACTSPRKYMHISIHSYNS
jgi:hypothetical protein